MGTKRSKIALPLNRQHFSALLDDMRPLVESLDLLCQPGAILTQHPAAFYFFARKGPARSSVFAFDCFGHSVGRLHFDRLDENQDGRWSPAVKAAYFRDMSKAFSTLSGKTCGKFDRDFLSLCRRGLPECLSKVLFRARYSCGMGMSDSFFFLHSAGGAPHLAESFERRWRENPALATAVLCLAQSVELTDGLTSDVFQRLKKNLAGDGIGKRGFAWLAHRSWDWVLRAHGTVGIKAAVRMRLSSAQLRIPHITLVSSFGVWLERLISRELASKPACRVDLSQLPSIIDFLRARFDEHDYPRADGANLGLPDNLQWAGLCRLSQQWHEDIQREKVGELVQFPVADAPDGLADCLGVDEVEQISDSVALYREGQQQSHCVYAYRNRCVDGDYAVFSMVVSGQRHTAGFIRDLAGRWSLDQVYRSCNRAPVPGAVRACRTLLRLVDFSPSGQFAEAA
jgi:hypothetical protein